ncbi:hypothetical protein EJB05_21927 [Eragrostis curvula]|uniref:Uncharacterized protein n=1 Tax=Eragrostis curvula TaxID=38414 RepID=A0A5J9V2V2_9POAL|nr:hypothetical protein EJB05_21927 [Eragrostis curvula]
MTWPSPSASKHGNSGTDAIQGPCIVEGGMAGLEEEDDPEAARLRHPNILSLILGPRHALQELDEHN